MDCCFDLDVNALVVLSSWAFAARYWMGRIVFSSGFGAHFWRGGIDGSKGRWIASPDRLLHSRRDVAENVSPGVGMTLDESSVLDESKRNLLGAS